MGKDILCSQQKKVGHRILISGKIHLAQEILKRDKEDMRISKVTNHQKDWPVIMLFICNY